MLESSPFISQLNSHYQHDLSFFSSTEFAHQIPTTNLHDTLSLYADPDPISFSHDIPYNPNQNTHAMTTRGKAGISKPQQFISLLAHTAFVELSSYPEAVKHQSWRDATLAEYNALLSNNSLSLVPPPSDATNIIENK